MGNDEVRISRKCEQCGAELKDSDKKCPKCGSDSMYAVQAGGTLPMQGSLNRVHVASWDGKSISILALIAAAIFPPAGYGIFELLPLSPWLKIAIWVLVVAGLGFIGFWQRYRVLMLTRWLGREFKARKRWHDK